MISLAGFDAMLASCVVELVSRLWDWGWIACASVVVP